jgi:hypothetical protein
MSVSCHPRSTSTKYSACPSFRLTCMHAEKHGRRYSEGRSMDAQSPPQGHGQCLYPHRPCRTTRHVRLAMPTAIKEQKKHSKRERSNTTHRRLSSPAPPASCVYTYNPPSPGHLPTQSSHRNTHILSPCTNPQGQAGPQDAPHPKTPAYCPHAEDVPSLGGWAASAKRQAPQVEWRCGLHDTQPLAIGADASGLAGTKQDTDKRAQAACCVLCVVVCCAAEPNLPKSCGGRLGSAGFPRDRSPCRFSMPRLAWRDSWVFSCRQAVGGFARRLTA